MSNRGGLGGFYSGSRLLNPVSDATGLPIDQINFLVCQLAGLALGFPFRSFLDPRKTSSQVRHIVELLLGVALVFFCFGRFPKAGFVFYLPMFILIDEHVLECSE